MTSPDRARHRADMPEGAHAILNTRSLHTDPRRLVAHIRDPQMVADGCITEEQRAAAEAGYRAWIETEAQSQTLYLLAVEGQR